jgi:integrase
MSIHKRSTRKGIVYDVRMRDPGGTNYKRTFRTKREAEAFDVREKADRSRGSWIDPRNAETTFGEWTQTWLAQPGSKRPRTIARDSDAVRLHMLPVLGRRPLATITPLDVQKLVTNWTSRFASTTTCTYYAILRAILNAAVAADLIARSPCRGIKLPAPRPTEARIVNVEQLHRLAGETDVANRPMVYLAAEAGLRWGECAGLRVRDLDFLRRTLTISENVGEVRGRIVVGQPKTRAGKRTIAVSSRLVELIGEHLARAGLTAADGDAYVFQAPDGGPLRYRNWHGRVWAPAVRQAGLEGLTFHALRHLSTTAMVASGVDPRTAQHRIGHATSRLVMELYAHATTEADRAAADRLGDLLFEHEERATRAIDAP